MKSKILKKYQLYIKKIRKMHIDFKDQKIFLK